MRMATIEFSAGDRQQRQAPLVSRQRPQPIVGQVEDCPGQALSPEHLAFLSARFQKLDGECAVPGHRGSHAVVRQGSAELGLVAVDGDLGIWFTALNSCGQIGNGETAVQVQQGLTGHGFACSKQGVLAVLYFHLLYPSLAAFDRPRGHPVGGRPPPADLHDPLAYLDRPAYCPACGIGRSGPRWARTETMGGRPEIAADQVRPPSDEA
jgi:hypothetical protein